MVRTRNKQGALTADEKKNVKALLEMGWRNQDIQALVNIGRTATVNSARITEVKKNLKQKAANKEEVEFFQIKKRAYDPKTGLNLFEDERLIRAREAMILAVQVFNSASLNFKTEVFAVLANIAWTYLLHEFYDRKGVKTIGNDGRALLLGQMIDRPDCPISDGMRKNLHSIKTIRDAVEHKLFGRGDTKWFDYFQACCLNFDKVLCIEFGVHLSLAQELSFALQFTRMNTGQLAILNRYELPEHINALDASLSANLSEDQLNDLEYQFGVIYTLRASSKGRAHFEFVRPESAEGREIRQVLIHYKPGDHLYPHKPGDVCKLVEKQTKKHFTMHHHTQAWRLFKIRPQGGSKQRENTLKDYCIYHPAFNSYTYSDKWIERLVKEVSDDERFAAIKAVKTN